MTVEASQLHSLGNITLGQCDLVTVTITLTNNGFESRIYFSILGKNQVLKMLLIIFPYLIHFWQEVLFFIYVFCPFNKFLKILQLFCL